MGSKDWCHVNTKLLPFKLHFFFYLGGFAGVLPFMPLIAKHLGINATAVGVGYSMIPVFIFLSNPIFGLLVDYFQNIKTFLIILFITSAVSYFSVLLLTKIEYEEDPVAIIRIIASNESESEHYINLPSSFQRTCLEELLEAGTNCTLVLNDNSSCGVPPHPSISLDVVYNDTFSDTLNKLPSDNYWISFTIEESSIFDANCFTNSSTSFQCLPTIHQCLIHEEHASVYSTYQFWTFMILVVVGGITISSASNLSSAACFELLGTKVESYGRQRLFGTIGWGLMCPLAGILNDIPKSPESSFSPGFYLMAIFIVVDITILCLIKIPKTHMSSNICSDLGKILSSTEILSFAFGVIVIGFLNSLIAVYEFWYLEDMGASKTLLGLTVFMQCLIGEVPFLFFSGCIVRKLGHFLCFASVFCAFAVRLGLYSILQNPWLALPIDVLHGVTFAIYHASMASFAKGKAPTGMEATLFGLFGGLYDGLGNGLGSFLGGVGLDNLGPKRMFFSASILSTGGLLLFLVASYFFRNQPSEKQEVTPLSQVDRFGVNDSSLNSI